MSTRKELADVITSMRVDGSTAKAITQHLNDSGYTTPRNTKIKEGYVSSMFRTLGLTKGSKKKTKTKQKPTTVSAAFKDTTSKANFIVNVVDATWMNRKTKIDVIARLI